MAMCRKGGFSVLLMMLLLGTGFQALAQEEGGQGDMPEEPDWEAPASDLYSAGDITLNLNLGVNFPLFLVNTGGEPRPVDKLKLGFMGGLGVDYFFTSGWFVGGEFEGMFMRTISGNTLFMVPIGARLGYQFVAGPIEIPLSLTVGFNIQSLLSWNYFGFFVKPQVGVFWRFDLDWSVGINAGWWWVPQWTSVPSQNMDGHFLELTLSAHYHF